MTRSTGRSRASTGRMSTRITNSWRRGATALALTLSLALPGRAWAVKPVEEKAASEAPPNSDAGKGNAKAKDKAAEEEGEKELPPALLKAIDERETQVTAARREAIRLLEDYLRDVPKSREEAEALYKLAELYWE